MGTVIMCGRVCGYSNYVWEGVLCVGTVIMYGRVSYVLVQ